MHFKINADFIFKARLGLLYSPLYLKALHLLGLVNSSVDRCLFTTLLFSALLLFTMNTNRYKKKILYGEKSACVFRFNK